MTDFQTGIITLMKCAVTGEGAQLPDGFSAEEAEAFAVKQNIVTLVYEGAVLCGISSREPAMQRMFQRYVQLMLHSERQLAAIAQISSAFDEYGIDYLPLKGCNMKKLYPKPELRYMGDADILIPLNQYEHIRKVMKELGFTEGSEYYHEYHWHKTDIHIELHKTLIPSTSKNFADYWGTGWEKARRIAGSRYELSSEDDFLFQFTHFAKHYMGPGIGCRYLLDLWVYLCAHPELDHRYMEQELSKLQLLEFYRNIRTLLSVWFEGKETNDRTDLITDFVFSGSSWGCWKNGQLSSALKNKKSNRQNKLLLILTKIFPPYSRMIYSYPILKKYPFLLPICWIFRIFSILLHDSLRRKKGLHMLMNVSGESLEHYKTNMQYVGLYFQDEQDE